MINYKIGDVTKIKNDNKKFIVHIVNNKGGWGKGFVLSLSREWPAPEKEYRKLFINNGLILGTIQPVKVSNDITVINMVAQKGYGKNNNNLHRSSEKDTEIPLQLDALEECMKKVKVLAIQTNAEIHAPRFGCGLAGGKWDQIEPLINKHWSELKVFIYDLG